MTAVSVPIIIKVMSIWFIPIMLKGIKWFSRFISRMISAVIMLGFIMSFSVFVIKSRCLNVFLFLA